jgi:hypothetical protein
MLGVVIALAAPASAAKAASVDEVWDWTSQLDTIHYAADPGEANDLTVVSVVGVNEAWGIGCSFVLGGIVTHCNWQVNDVDVLRDPGASIRGECGRGGHIDTVVCGPGPVVATLGDGDDHASVAANAHSGNILTAGPGDDELNTLNGLGGDQVYCGTGDDTVTADAGDFVADSCEHRNLKRVPIP